MSRSDPKKSPCSDEFFQALLFPLRNREFLESFERYAVGSFYPGCQEQELHVFLLVCPKPSK